MRCAVFYDYEDGSFHEVQNLRWIFCKGGVKKGNPLLLVGDWVFGWRGYYVLSVPLSSDATTSCQRISTLNPASRRTEATLFIF